jgi:L-lactate dehydrogenase complex protein LldG
MPTAREQILHDIRRTLPTDSPLPPLTGPWTRYDDPHAQFLEVLRGVGGAGHIVVDADSLRRELQQLIDALAAKQICSVLPEFMPGNVDMADIDDPHQLADVDLAILPGELAVAENAAVWVTGTRVPQRVAFFLSQHVVLIVPEEHIVNNMHEAYDWLHAQAGPGGPFAEPRWGTFMSGPSKTADIEQALVIGAHGARSLHVFFLAAP